MFAVVALMCLFPFHMEAKADGQGIFKIENAECSLGEEIKIEVVMENNPGIIAARLDIGYDENILTFVKAEDKGLLNEYIESNPERNPYVLCWADALAESDNMSNGVIAELTFRVNENTEADYTELEISFDPENVFDKDLNNKSFRVENGIVTIRHDGNAVGTGDAVISSGINSTVSVTDKQDDVQKVNEDVSDKENMEGNENRFEKTTGEMQETGINDKEISEEYTASEIASENNENSADKKSTSKLVWITVFCVIVIVIATVLGFAIKKKKRQDRGKGEI